MKRAVYLGWAIVAAGLALSHASCRFDVEIAREGTGNSDQDANGQGNERDTGRGRGNSDAGEMDGN